MTLLICWMSVFAYAISWPVCAWSWKREVQALQVRDEPHADVGLDAPREPERGVAPQAGADGLHRADRDDRRGQRQRDRRSSAARSRGRSPRPRAAGPTTRAAAQTSPAPMPRIMRCGWAAIVSRMRRQPCLRVCVPSARRRLRSPLLFGLAFVATSIEAISASLTPRQVFRLGSVREELRHHLREHCRSSSRARSPAKITIGAPVSPCISAATAPSA